MRDEKFVVLREAVKKSFKKMFDNNDVLFVVNADKDHMWELYLDSFPAGMNKMYRKHREYDCSCCRHFLKSVGAVVSVNNGVMTSVWDNTVVPEDSKFAPVVEALKQYIHSLSVENVYICSDNQTKFGCDINYDDAMEAYEHFSVLVPDKFTCRGMRNFTTGDIPEKLGWFRDNKNVFARSLSELTGDSVDTVLELIAQGSLYKGNEWKDVLTKFRKYQKDFDKASDKELFAWENSIKAGVVISRLRNHSIGTLLIDISNGVDLDDAVKSYERVVAPSNYKRPKAIYTQKMLDDAKEKITAMGYMDSLARRFACANDITVNNILFCNRDVAPKIAGADDIFGEMAKGVKASAKKFSGVEEISIEKFLTDVLPTATSVEAYTEGRLSRNLVSLVAPAVKDSKTMFKWNNNFSWAYNGNITDSDIKANVKNAGGDVTGALRFSIQWNDGEYDNTDEDAHCKTPTGEIYFANKRVGNGELDVDITHPSHGVPAVENITFSSVSGMRNGEYKFFVECYADRGSKGFKAEIEFDGNIYQFNYPKHLRNKERVDVATVTLKDGRFAIKPNLEFDNASVETWGVSTNQFVPVSVICNSPNYWDEQKGIGNKHYFFFLEGCTNDGTPNGFFNEFLNEELMEHKRVMEALGSKCHVAECENQLSGYGFSDTQRNELIVKVKGSTERVVKIKF